jgi:hypothetical protein
MYPGFTPSPLAQYLATRSAIPKIVGILAMIFAPVGAMASAIWTWGPLDDIGRWSEGDWDAVSKWLLAWGMVSGLLFAVHLIAGIMAMLYRPSAPRWTTIYAIAAILLGILDAVLVVVLSPSGGGHHYIGLHESVVTMHLVFCVLSLAWPITAAILMNTARAKRACVIPPG